MRKLILLLLSGVLSTACVDKDYDLGNIDTDNIAIGDEGSQFRIPLVKVLVSKDEIKNNDGDIEKIFREADIWFPTQLPDDKFVDLVKLQNEPAYVNTLLRTLREEMQTSDAKLASVVDLVWDKYAADFLPLLNLTAPDEQTFKTAFKTAYRNDASLRERLADEVSALARTYLTGSLGIDQLEYEVGHIDISSDIVDMLADNLDPEGTPNARNTLFLYGQITSGLPLSLRLDPRLSPTEVTFQVEVGVDKTSNDIPETQLFAEDLRQIVEGITIRIPVTLTEYYPGKGFSDDQYQIVISLSLLKNGGLKLDI
ncbi:MAG: hypothetical protein KHZ60_10835 [Alistipes sp.]|jgi:hypothetical protein|uniref:hypothetical protein n=1 Tax=Alistipes sp. TaxID=1872444 RepID=UPI001DC94A81|nr:hypothetical protein [Alistipes sp.]MBS5020546.1 hypothetical protein [Alistipes sp.]